MSRSVLARIAALFYLLNFVLGGFAFSLARKAATPLSDAVTVAAAVDYAIVALLLGVLFQQGNPALSWTVAAVGLAGCVLSAAQSLHLVGTWMNPLAVFGVYCLGLGLLIVRSRLMPRVIGVLLMIGGVSWLTFVSPALATTLAPANMAPGAIAELIFTFWLLMFGVRTPALRQTGASASPTAHLAGA